MLVPRLSDMVLATIYEGVDEAAAEHGYLTFVSNTQDEPEMCIRDRAWSARRRGGQAQDGPARGLLPIALASVYGGFFGAGLGVILTAVISITDPGNLRAIKSVSYTHLSPRFDTIAKVCKALGVRLVVQAEHPA